MSSSLTTTISLYGGAIQMSLPLYTSSNNELPSATYNFIDTSQFRQVPDYQEVYNDLDTGLCVIIELLDLDNTVCDREASYHHFTNLALANGCVNVQRSVEQQPSDPSFPFDSIITSPPTDISDDQCPHFPLGPITTYTQEAREGCLTSNSGVPVVLSKSIVDGRQLIAKYHRVKDAAGVRDDRNEVYVGLAVIRLAPPVATDIVISVSAPLRIAEGSSEQGVVTRPLTPQEARYVLETAIHTVEVKRWGLFI